MAFIEFSRNQQLAKKVKMFFALAPVTTVGYIKGAFKVLSNIGPELLVSLDNFFYQLLSINVFSVIVLMKISLKPLIVKLF